MPLRPVAALRCGAHRLIRARATAALEPAPTLTSCPQEVPASRCIAAGGMAGQQPEPSGTAIARRRAVVPRPVHVHGSARRLRDAKLTIAGIESLPAGRWAAASTNCTVRQCLRQCLHGPVRSCARGVPDRIADRMPCVGNTCRRATHAAHRLGAGANAPNRGRVVFRSPRLLLRRAMPGRNSRAGAARRQRERRPDHRQPDRPADAVAVGPGRLDLLCVGQVLDHMRSWRQDPNSPPAASCARLHARKRSGVKLRRGALVGGGARGVPPRLEGTPRA
jgi:hypothetical protein